jgi:hypothetical protein
MEKTNILIAGLSMVAAVLLVATILLSSLSLIHVNAQADKNTKFVACISTWANQTARRTSILTGLNVKRQDKLDLLIRDFSLAGSKDPKVQKELHTKFFNHLHRYIGVSNEYKKALVDHPPPPAPQLACANAKK